MRIGILLTLSITASGKSLPPLTPTLVIGFDGFRHDYLNGIQTHYFSELLKRGVRAPAMVPQFPASTFTNFASLSTGLYPDSHGIVDNHFYDPAVGRILSEYLGDDGYWTQTQRSDILPIWVRIRYVNDR